MTKHRPIIGTFSDANTAIGIIYGPSSKKPTKRDLHRRYRVVVSLPPEDLAANGSLDFIVTSNEGDLIGSAWHVDLLDLQTVLVDRRIRRATFAIIDITKSRVGTPIHVEVMELDDLVNGAIAEAAAEAEDAA